MSASQMIGKRVRVRDAYLDEACTRPVVGTVEDVLENGYRVESGRFDGITRFVVMFDHDDPHMPPRGEFTFNRLAAIRTEA